MPKRGHEEFEIRTEEKVTGKTWMNNAREGRAELLWSILVVVIVVKE